MFYKKFHGFGLSHFVGRFGFHKEYISNLLNLVKATPFGFLFVSLLQVVRLLSVFLTDSSTQTVLLQRCRGLELLSGNFLL